MPVVERISLELTEYDSEWASLDAVCLPSVFFLGYSALVFQQ